MLLQNWEAQTLAFFGVSKKGLGASLWVARVSLEVGGKWTALCRFWGALAVELLEAGITPAGSMGLAGLDSQSAVG